LYRLGCSLPFFFPSDPAPTEIYTLSLHDALPISLWHADVGADPCSGDRVRRERFSGHHYCRRPDVFRRLRESHALPLWPWPVHRSEEHTSELQSRGHLVCRLLLEKKKH